MQRHGLLGCCWMPVLQIHTTMLAHMTNLVQHAYLYQVHGRLHLLREACQPQHALRDTFRCI